MRMRIRISPLPGCTVSTAPSTRMRCVTSWGFSRTVPTGNLLLSILDVFDIKADHFGESTGRLERI